MRDKYSFQSLYFIFKFMAGQMFSDDTIATQTTTL